MQAILTEVYMDDIVSHGKDFSNLFCGSYTKLVLLQDKATIDTVNLAVIAEPLCWPLAVPIGHLVHQVFETVGRARVL